MVTEVKISVVVPNYNHAPWLAQRIDSILAQSLGDFELLLLDDASTDDSRELLAAYARDPRVRTDFNTVNTGSPYVQWQRGLALSSGDYIWIAQSDDFAEPAFLERLVDALDSDPTIGIAVADSRVVDAAGHFLHDHHTNWAFLAPPAPFTVIDGKNYCRAHMHPWNSIPNVSATVIRRTAFAAIGGPVLDMGLCGDWMTYARMLMRFNIARVPVPLNSFRWHDQSVRNRTNGAAFVRQAVEVQTYLEQELALSRATSDRAVSTFLTQALIASERRQSDAKVPLPRVPRLIGAAARLGPRILFDTARIMLRESVSLIVRKLIRR